jgi:hypothetical protein
MRCSWPIIGAGIVKFFALLQDQSKREEGPLGEHQGFGSPANLVCKKGCFSGCHFLLLSLRGMQHAQL